ncbi:MAG: hypothetical protein IJI26_00935 [Clostridia bacterium]|nr:hypothetical protein [Clostridia bacterium]
MKPTVYSAFVTEEYTDQCPQCGGPMQQVPYYSAMVTKGGTHREMASLTKDRIVTTYNLSFITPHMGGYCPACTRQAVEKENENILENNKKRAAAWDSLSEKERKVRSCPVLTVVALVCMALALLMLLLWLFKVVSIGEGLALGIMFLVFGGILGLISWASNDGLFPLRHNPSEGKPHELYDMPDFSTYTAEELAKKIVDRLDSGIGAGPIATRNYYTPGAMQRMQR